MATTIKETEALPSAYPTPPSGLSTEAAALNSDAIWQRIEAYCRVRWTERSVVWVIEGPGDWEAPLSPINASSEDVWSDGAWSDVTLPETPLGGSEMAEAGPYRVTASVGGGTPPEAVLEAYRRLAEYLAEVPDRQGVSSFSFKLGDAIEESYQRNAAWIARAMDLSGAADLLRPYKRRL